MKILSLLPALSLAGAALLTTGCANVLFYGNDASVQIAAEYKTTDASEPVTLQVGIRDRTAMAVPPRYSLPSGDLSNENRIAQGEILSTGSAFSIDRVTENGVTTTQGATRVRIRNVLFTGIAAEKLAGVTDSVTQRAAMAQDNREVDAAVAPGTAARALAVRRTPTPRKATTMTILPGREERLEPLATKAKEIGAPTPKPTEKRPASEPIW